MKLVRRRDTDGEMRLRLHLHALGFRYRVNYRFKGAKTVGDIVFISARLAVFVDGCFWHGCPMHGTVPKTNTAWWLEKIRANVARDERSTASLEDLGWHVLRIWSHEDVRVAEVRIRKVLQG